MRKTSTLLFTAVIALMAAVTSCNKENTEDIQEIPEIKPITLTKAETEVLNSGTGFSFNLFREVASRNSYENIFLPPLSVHIANCMLANGAGGETYSQIVRTMGYEGISIDDVNSAYNTLVSGLKNVDTSTKLEIANSVWVSDRFPVSPSFTDAMTRSYDAYVNNLDFSSKNAVKTINKWCSDNTDKMIPEFIKELEGNDVLILMNALYFNGKWKEKFESSKTTKDKFSTLNAGAVQKDFMHITKDFAYAETADEKIRMCELPYGNGAFVMDVILPDKDLDFKDFIDGMTGEGWESMFTYRRSHKVILSLPKFKVESEYELDDALKAMGMVLPYDQVMADLKKMCSDSSWQLWVDRTLHKAVIEVDEDGSKAAAVTAHIIKGDSSPGPAQTIEFNCDHPFMYLIRETTSGAILFMGTITK